METTDLIREIASRRLDLPALGAFGLLPNPDPILRRLGRRQDVYEAISYDAHVVSELRPIRASLLEFEHLISPASESSADMRAAELCELVFTRQPAPNTCWGDVWWAIEQAVFHGFSVHEIIWDRVDGMLLPVQILDREQHRFNFNIDNELLLLSPGQPYKVLDNPHKWLLGRHMPSAANPYGYALFSAVFWPWTFKHRGMRFFSKLAERFGVPWTIGRYPPGTSKEDQDALADALAEMIETAVAAIPQGSEVELLSSGTTMAQAPSERLIKLCNTEISKGLSSQTLATETQGEGSRAASETHNDRGERVAACDRRIVISVMNDLCRAVTELNVPGADAPTFEFYEEDEARQGWVEVLDKARHIVDIPSGFAHDRLQIPQPVGGEPVVPRDTGSAPANPAEFAARPSRSLPSEDAIEQLLAAVSDEQLQAVAEDVTGPLIDIIRSDGPAKALQTMAAQYPNLNSVRLQQLLAQVMFIADTWGRLMSQARDTDA